MAFTKSWSRFTVSAAVLALCLTATSMTQSAEAKSPAPMTERARQAEFRQAADRLYAAYSRAFRDRDVNILLNEFFSDDAISAGPEHPVPSIGHEGIREESLPLMDSGLVTITPYKTFVTTNAAWEWTTVTVTPREEKNKPFSMMVLYTFVKKNGKWLATSEAYSIGRFPNGK